MASENINQNVSVINKAIAGVQTLSSNLETAGRIFTTAFAIKNITEIATEMWDMEKSMRQLSVRMGNAAKGTKELTSAVIGLQKNFGIAYTDAKGIVETLAKGNVKKNLTDAATGAALFAKASGVASERVASITRSLNIDAKMSIKSINSMYAGMVKVQQRSGLTEEGMSAVSERISEAAQNMRIFGKTDLQIASMGVNTARLASGLEKVGINAETAMKWMSDLTDPDRIEDNIALYAQLGVSISDVMSGNVDMASELMSGKMQDLGKRITDMGYFAGSQFAKSLGISYKEASKMATASFTETANVTASPEEQAISDLDKLMKETRNFAGKLEDIGNKIHGWLNSLGPIFLSIGALLFLVAKNSFKKIRKQASIATEELGNGITESGKKSFYKLAEIAKKPFKEIGRNLSGTIENSLNGAELEKQFLSMGKKIGIGLSDRVGYSVGGKVLGLASIPSSISNAYNKNFDSKMMSGASSFSVNSEEYSRLVNSLREKANGSTTDSLKNHYNKMANTLSANMSKSNMVNNQGNAYSMDEIISRVSKYNEAVSSGKTSEANNIYNSFNSAMKKISRMSNSGFAELTTNLKLEQKAKADIARQSAKDALEEFRSAKKRQIQLMANDKTTGEALVDAQIQVEKLKKAFESLNKESIEQNKLLNKYTNLKSNERRGGILSNFASSVSASFGGFADSMSSRSGNKFNSKTGNVAYGTLLTGFDKISGGLKKMLGPLSLMGIGMLFLKPIMSKLQPILQELADVFMNSLEEPINIIGNILNQPSIKSAIKNIGVLFGELVKALLPPMLKILGFLLKAITLVPKTLSTIFGWDGPLAKTINSVYEVGDSLMKTNLDNTEALEKNTDSKTPILKLNANGDTIGEGSGTPSSPVANFSSSSSSSALSSFSAEQTKAINNLNDNFKTLTDSVISVLTSCFASSGSIGSKENALRVRVDNFPSGGVIGSNNDNDVYGRSKL